MTDRPYRPGADEAEDGRPTVRDKRRIDPETYELRDESAAAPAAGADGAPAGSPASTDPDPADPTPADQVESEKSATPESEELAEAQQRVADLTVDLQRLQAEYVNYRRRVERDREATRDGAVAKTLESLLPVLDDIGRAREAGELEGGFKAVAESLERVVTGLGLEAFGEVGDEFDPRRHEALMHAYSDDVMGPTCQAVLQVGYTYRDKVVRAARVAVAEPQDVPAAAPVDETDES